MASVRVRRRLGLLGLALTLRGAPLSAAESSVEVPGPGPKVTVILDAPAGSRLMRENVYGWGSVCTAPCSARVPRDGDFVVEVPGSKSTAVLDLEEGPERVRLKLTLPSQAALVTGTLLTYFGASTASTGLLVVLAGLALRDDRAVITGAVVAGVGGVGVCVGVPLIVMNHHSHVEQQSVAQGVRLFGRF